MTHSEIIADLKSRGEHSITFKEDGTIVSLHGKNTINTWMVRNAMLICIDCRTSY